MLAEARLPAWAAPFPLRLFHIPTVGPRGGVCVLPWHMPRGRGRVLMRSWKRKAPYSLMIRPPRHRWFSRSSQVGWLILSLYFPKSDVHSSLAAPWWWQCGVISSFRICSFSPPRGTQLLAALVLPEALWCHHGWFFLWKMPTPQSYGNGEPKGTVVIKWPKEEDPRCQVLFSTP